MITQKRLRELVKYNRKTGVFTWLTSRPPCTVGGIAGSLNSRGYWRIGLDNRMYFAHRLAWLYTTGEWPHAALDHRDGSPANNKLSNLREASAAENSQNKKTRTDASSGYAGVTKFRNKWQAQINVRGEYHYLGLFSTPELAHESYLAAKARLHEFQPKPRK